MTAADDDDVKQPPPKFKTRQPPCMAPTSMRLGLYGCHLILQIPPPSGLVRKSGRLRSMYRVSNKQMVSSSVHHVERRGPFEPYKHTHASKDTVVWAHTNKVQHAHKQTLHIQLPTATIVSRTGCGERQVTPPAPSKGSTICVGRSGARTSQTLSLPSSPPDQTT